MSRRIYLGPSGGNFVFRISPPGYDAADRASPAVFSSDGEYLKVHAVIDEVLNRNGYDYHWGAYTFPTLGYIPLAFPSISMLDRVFYPNDRAAATYEMVDFWQWGVQDGKVWAGTDTPNGLGGRYRFRCIIFKNRADRYISA